MSRETTDASHEGFPVAGAVHGAGPLNWLNTRNLDANWQGKPCYPIALLWPDDTDAVTDPLPDGGAPPARARETR